MNTITKEDCIKAINNYIKFKTIDNAISLLTLFLNYKQVAQKEMILSVFIENPQLFVAIEHSMIGQLITEFKLITLSDRTNNIILVY